MEVMWERGTGYGDFGGLLAYWLGGRFEEEVDCFLSRMCCYPYGFFLGFLGKQPSETT